uniref:F-box domain-containing protein n=1 Tax=Opuntia streptacantha TaxID=393608 RepID=A0A7C9CPS6_OPUST
MCNMERELPEEIKLDIFSRLPPKSIGRCRCLSKQWRALLSQTNFIETHLHLSKTHREKSLIIISIRLGALFSISLSNAHHVFDEITVSASNLSFADRPHSWNAVYGSCNGLLLVDDAEHNMFVLNPTTREIRGVPSWPLDLEDGNNFKYGFGYDSISDDYNIVVHVCHFEDECECEPYCTHEAFFYVYSLKNGTWKRVRSHPFDADVGSAVFLNGRVHWLAHVGDKACSARASATSATSATSASVSSQLIPAPSRSTYF